MAGRDRMCPMGPGDWRSKLHFYVMGLSGVTKAYLFAYNIAACAGWSYLLFLVAQHVREDPWGSIWEKVELPLKVTQTAAFLEVVHAVLRFVRSGPFTSFLQVWSRVFVVWALMDVSATAQADWCTTLTVASWSLVEVPRYVFYALKVYDLPVPSFLTFLRYHLFMVLYPSGITGEIVTLWKSLEDIKRDKPYTVELPNAYNGAFSLYWFCLVTLAMYVPGSPFMYKHMLRQRNKVYAKAKSA